MKTSLSVIAALLALAPAARADDAANRGPTFMRADQIRWGAAPPSLPRGGEVAVLYGDPRSNAPFALRLKAPAGYRIPPHWHSQDEQLTVISGTLMLHMGDSMDSSAHALDAGSFHFLPGKMHHAAEMKGETVVQINGMGPFDIHYLNSADDPRNASAASKADPSRSGTGRQP